MTFTRYMFRIQALNSGGNLLRESFAPMVWSSIPPKMRRHTLDFGNAWSHLANLVMKWLLLWCRSTMPSTTLYIRRQKMHSTIV